MTRFAVRGRKRVRVVKIQLRPAKLGNGLVLDRDVIGSINTGLRYLPSDGSPVALGSTEPHEVRVKLMNPHQGLNPLTKLKVLKTNQKYRERKRLYYLPAVTITFILNLTPIIVLALN